MRTIQSRVLLSIIFLIAMSATGIAQSGRDSACTPSFPYQQQWQGADAAYSIPLPDGRDVWIFGDTLFGDKRQVTGDDPRMVHNSIGISTCKNGKWKLDYTLRRAARRRPTSFFAPKNEKTWYWALDGAYDADQKQLWVSLLCVRAAPKGKPAALGFEICGTDLARITNVSASPADWKVEYYPLVPENVHANPSASALIQNGDLYFFTLYEQGSRPQILVRMGLNKMTDPKGALEYLAKDGTWSKGIDPENAKTVMENGASEMSVRYHPELKKWVAVLVDPTLFSDKILLRTSPAIDGPWTAGEEIYHIPEMQKSSAHYDADTFCYAGKEHPEFEKPGELVFTYVCNTMKPKKLEQETYIYHPMVVRMKMPDIAQR